MRFLAIDPSTTSMGLVLFDDGQPVEVETVEEKGDTLARINAMISAITPYLYLQQIEMVACETWGGPRNPAGRTLIKGIQDSVKGAKLGWYTYHSNTVVRAVAPRGWRTRMTEQRKAAMYHGVLGIWPQVEGIFVTQDEYDAAAVGAAHINALREVELGVR